MSQQGGSTMVARARDVIGELADLARDARCRAAAVAALAICLIAPARTHAGQVFSFRDRNGTQYFTNVPTDKRYRVMKLDRARVTRFSYKPSANVARPRRSYGIVRTERLWNEPPADLSKLIDRTARRYGVEPALVHAVVRAESAFDHLAISSAGAQGLMQLMPTTASEVGVRDAFHPEENLAGGVYYLRQLIDRFSGNVQLAVAAYNAGPGAVERFGGVPPYRETLDYLQRVFRFRQEYLRRSLAQRFVVAAR